MARKLLSPIHRRHWLRRCGLAGLLGLLVIMVGIVPAYAAGDETNASVTINPNQILSTVSPLAVGVNDAVWDGNLQNAQVPELLRADGIRVMRFPGGSTADQYHWQTNTLDNGSSAGTDSFDQFMRVVKKVGAEPIITVNYGSGTPAEAAAWVQYANKVKHYHIHYWEIGNELYGNGTYGATWETDKHAPGPASYANNSVQFIQAMKTVDPSIQVGLVVTAPGNWPDGQTSASSPQPWNDTVLPIACSYADFAAVHWYAQGPGGESDAGLLNAPANGESTSTSYTPSIPSMVSTLRAKIGQGCGAHASAMKIMTTETNSVSYNPGKQTTGLVNALFLAGNYMTWLENGVTSVDWWDVHNGAVTGTNDNPSLYGSTTYGDYGLLSAASTGEPAVDTPFPDYYGLQIVSKVLGDHAQIIAASSDQNAVQAFAVQQGDGSVAVLLINTDPNTTYRVSIAGLKAHGWGHTTVYSYGENSTAVGVTYEDGDDAGSQTIAPYSLTALVVR